MKKLQIYLRANAAFSTFSGLVLTLGAKNMSQLIGIKQDGILLLIGLGLILFATMVFFASKRTSPVRAQIISIIYADVSWVIMSFIVVIFQLFQLTNMGYTLITIVGGIVGLFAFLQYSALKALSSQVG